MSGGAALLCAAALSGCSAVRLGYDQGPWLVGWWLDRRVDFNDEQKAMIRASLGQWFAWHRGTQLPVYADALARAAAESTGPVSPARLCALADEVRGWMTPAVQQILPALASLAVTLSPAQVEQLALRLSRDADERLQKALKGSPQERREAAVQRLVDRYESLYGAMLPAQLAVIDKAMWLDLQDIGRQQAQRRQREEAALDGLRRIAGQRLSGPDALALVREIAPRVLQPPQADGGAWLAQVRQQGCEAAAQIHALATPEQRKHLVGRLKEWERDARQLARR